MSDYAAKCVECGKEIEFDIFPVLMRCQCGSIYPMKMTKLNGKLINKGTIMEDE